MTISFQIGINIRRGTTCQAPHLSKLRGKIGRAPKRKTNSTSKIDLINIRRRYRKSKSGTEHDHSCSGSAFCSSAGSTVFLMAFAACLFGIAAIPKVLL